MTATDEPNVYTWTPQAFEEAKREAREMDLSHLPAFIEKCLRRSHRDDQVVGVCVLACVAAYTATLRTRRKRPMASQLALAALMTYRELMGLNGPFRVIAYEQMLRPGTEKHFEPVVDWQAAGWLAEEAHSRLLTLGMEPKLKQWLTRISLGILPYGWTSERKLLPDGFRRQ